MRYHLFAGYNYYPDRGLGDYVSSYDTPEEAVEEGSAKITSVRGERGARDWYSVLYQDHIGNLAEYDTNWRR